MVYTVTAHLQGLRLVLRSICAGKSGFFLAPSQKCPPERSLKLGFSSSQLEMSTGAPTEVKISEFSFINVN